MKANHIASLPLTGLLLLCLACADKEFDPTPWVKRGRNTVEPFKKELKGALVEGLKAGPENAIDVCQRLAPEIAEQAGNENVRLGRTSHKLRNPDNAPAEWMKPLLEYYLANPHDSEPQAVQLAGGVVGYAEPIRVQPVCLACHGREIAPEVAAQLAEHYPEDQATGFAASEFRGLFWVEFNETD